MSIDHLKAPNPTSAIFDQHFAQTLGSEDFERARSVFDSVGQYNERSLATQLETAHQVGKLEEVLRAYEKLAAPDSWLWNVPNIAQRVAEVRMYTDVVYQSVLLGEDEGLSEFLELMDRVEVPKIFDLMEPPGVIRVEPVPLDVNLQ